MKRQRLQQTVRRGFTLIEVLLVLAILGVIAAMVVPQLMGTQEKAMRDRARADMRGIETALKKYTTEHDGNFPETLEELTTPQPLEDGTTPPPYVESIIDPWGSKYVYRRPGDGNSHLNSSNGMAYLPELYSWGPDKTDDGGEEPNDINNWDERIRDRNAAP